MSSSKTSEEELAFLQSVGIKVKALRKEQGLTQDEVAQACGLNKHYISDIEHGKRNPALLTVLKIVKALNAKMDDLLK